MIEPPRALCCPICGRELGAGLTQHATRDRWTVPQIWLVRRLRALGGSQKMCARVLGTQPDVVANLEARLRHDQRVAREAGVPLRASFT